MTDHPEAVFSPGVVLIPAGEDDRTPDPSRAPLRIESSRPFRRGFLIRFGGVDQRDLAERLRDLYLLRPFEELEDRGEDEIFYHELLGMRVETVAGELVGTIGEVYELRAGDLLEVHKDGVTRLLPFTSRVVVSTDLERGVMVIDPPEGLLDL